MVTLEIVSSKHQHSTSDKKTSPRQKKNPPICPPVDKIWQWLWRNALKRNEECNLWFIVDPVRSLSMTVYYIIRFSIAARSNSRHPIIRTNDDYDVIWYVVYVVTLYLLAIKQILKTSLLITIFYIWKNNQQNDVTTRE